MNAPAGARWAPVPDELIALETVAYAMIGLATLLDNVEDEVMPSGTEIAALVKLIGERAMTLAHGFARAVSEEVGPAVQ